MIITYQLVPFCDTPRYSVPLRVLQLRFCFDVELITMSFGPKSFSFVRKTYLIFLWLDENCLYIYYLRVRLVGKLVLNRDSSMFKQFISFMYTFEFCVFYIF